MPSSPTPPTPRLGIQLYTVRDLTDPAAFRDTLGTLARLGFEGVEFAWKYGDLPPEPLATMLHDLGLACCGLHAKLDELLQPDHAVYRIATAVASPYITTSLCGREAEWDQLLPQLNAAGRIAAGHGLRFTYHNHWQEFDAAPGASAYDRLVRETDAAHVGLELDLGWVHKAGWDAMALWRALAARTPQIHLRDYDRGSDQVCDPGDGFIDLGSVRNQARDLNTAWLIYEQDRYPVSPLDSCRLCAERWQPCVRDQSR